MMRRFSRVLLLALFALFCFAYPFAVIGVAFDVRPPFSLDWAGSALLFVEGALLIVAAMLLYGNSLALFVGLLVIGLSYAVETLGVNTAFPFGAYRYTPVLFPRLPGGVPLAVMFAWVLIVFGAYGWVAQVKRPIGLRGALFGALLAMLLDLAIEPVAFHVVRYWEWFDPGPLNYYGVPLANFVAWFVVACLLLLLADAAFSHFPQPKWSLPRPRLAFVAPRLLFVTSLFMFGLVDLTHGYYLATFFALLAAALLYFIQRRR
jgi:putative membrane protein